MTRLRWNGPTDLEICIMSARSARRTRRRRWRMGRDRAGEREMRRTHGRRVAAKHLSSRGGSVAFCFSHPRTSSFIRTPKCFPPCCFPSTFRFHGPHRVWIRFGNFLPFLMPTAGWKIRTAAAAAGQTITRTTDEATRLKRNSLSGSSQRESLELSLASLLQREFRWFGWMKQFLFAL